MDEKTLTEEKLKEYSMDELIAAILILVKELQDFKSKYADLGSAVVQLDGVAGAGFKDIGDVLNLAKKDIYNVQQELKVTITQIGPMYAEWVAKKEDEHYNRRKGKKLEYNM